MKSSDYFKEKILPVYILVCGISSMSAELLYCQGKKEPVFLEMELK